MKIIFLSTWADAVGGTEHMVFRQANWLAQHHEVEIIGVFRSRKEKDLVFHLDPKVTLTYLVDGTDAVHRPVRGGLDDASCQALTGLRSSLVDPTWEGAFNALTDLELGHALRARDADIVISTTPALLAVATTLMPQTVVVHQEHRVSELRGSSSEPLFKHGPRADAIVLLSEPTRAWFEHKLGDGAPALAVIPNPAEPGFHPRSSRNTKTIVWAGRLTTEKQPLDAIRAFAMAAQDNPDWTLRLFGSGAQLAVCQREIAAHGLGLRVQLMGVGTDMRSEWARAAIALLTSRAEAFPVVLLEAATAAVPLVTYDCPNGPAEIVREGETGFLVTLGDVEGLASALRKLIESDELRHRMGEAAAESTQAWQLDEVMSKWEGLYQALYSARHEPNWAERKLQRVAAYQIKSAEPADPDAGTAAAVSPTLDHAIWAGAVEARHPDLVWSGAQLTAVSDVMSAADVTLQNLELVADTLEKAGIDYLLLSDLAVSYRVAVRADQRAQVATALAAFCAAQPVYVDALDQRRRSRGSFPAAGMSVSTVSDPLVTTLRVYKPIVSACRTLRYGSVYGCTIDFLATSEDETEVIPSIAARIGNSIPVDAMIPVTTVIAEREYPTIEVLTKTLPDDINFPIDVVYTWVDSSDPVWQAKRAANSGTAGNAADGDARYRSRDELRFSFRSLDMFAPWVNHIWLVTDGQTPEWLDRSHPGVTVVDHREIFADPNVLPTFNSHAIESQLHQIDGLAEQFLYFNDDVFLGRPVLPRMFFEPSGQPHCFRSPTQVPVTSIRSDDDFNISAAKNNRALLEAKFGRTLTHGFLHVPHPHRRTLIEAMFADFAEARDRVMRSKVRSADDISPLSSLAQYYGLFSGNSVLSQLKSGFINAGLREHHARFDRVLFGRGFDVFCINDFHDGDVSTEEQDLIINAFLSAYFPMVSQFERGSPRNRRLLTDQSVPA